MTQIYLAFLGLKDCTMIISSIPVPQKVDLSLTFAPISAHFIVIKDISGPENSILVSDSGSLKS